MTVPKPSSVFKFNWWTILKVVVGVSIFLWLVLDDQIKLENLKKYPIKNLCFAGVSFFFMQVFNVARLMVVMRIANHSLTFVQGFLLVSISFSLNQILPGNYGGDIFKGTWLSRQDQDRKGMSGGIVIIDRVIGLSALILIGLVSSVFLSVLHAKHSELFLTSAIILSMILAVVIGFCLVIFFYKRKDKHIFNIKFFQKEIFRNVHDGMVNTILSPRRVFLCGFLSLGTHLSALFGVYMLVLGTGFDGNGFEQISLASLVMTGGVVPVSVGNLGWTEWLASEGWQLIGLSNGAEIFFAWRGISWVFVSLGFLFIPFIKSNQLNTRSEG